MARDSKTVFISYSHDDEDLRRELVQHLAALRREGKIDTWDDREITGGEEWRGQIAEQLEAAGLVLLLVSAPFIAADYCWDVETTRALERHARGEARTIAGDDTRAVEGEILDVRRLLRKGPQLRAGEFLGDGRYELLEVIGQGGFATVWKAWDEEAQGLVALKVLHGHYAEDRGKRERFFRGAQKMGELVHPRVVRVLENEWEDEGWRFFVMEYIVGGNFEQAALGGRFSLEKRLAIVLQAGEALEMAHEQGAVHRDVKPANILIDAADEAKLTDFDLVRAEDTTGLTATRAMMGTVQFAAPESLESAKNVGPPADVYSLGATAVFAVLGDRLPAWFYRDPGRAIGALKGSEELKEVLARALAFEPDARFGSIQEFCRALAVAARPAVPNKKSPEPNKKGPEPARRPADEVLHLGQKLQSTANLQQRAGVFESIPDQLGDAEASLALVEQLRQDNRDGFDLFWLWWIVEEVERRWRPGHRARDLLARFFDHIPAPGDPELFREIDSPLDGTVALWREIGRLRSKTAGKTAGTRSNLPGSPVTRQGHVVSAVFALEN